MHVVSDKGHPISPMLFVIVMEVLNSLIREADRRGALSPLPGRAILHRASLYADVVVILVAPSHGDLNCVQQILHLFAGASGLVANIDKCVATPIHCTEEMVAGCRRYSRALLLRSHAKKKPRGRLSSAGGICPENSKLIHS